MRILLLMPAGGEAIPGGHMVQMEKTAQALRALGAEVELSFAPGPDLAGVEVLHAFGAVERSVIREARHRGIRVAISPIYWPLDYRLAPYRSARARARLAAALLRRGERALAGRLFGQAFRQALAYEAADVLLPNSEPEAKSIQRDLGVSTPMRVVPNGVDTDLFTEGSGEHQTVLYVGRIEPHKNQLALIHALSGTRFETVIAGPPHPHHERYYDECRREAGPNIRWHPGGEQSELVELYRAARVHVLPSRFETTGLVSLEAALCGCAIVTTDRGYASSYFGDMAYYCSTDPQSIRRAVEVAWERGAHPDLAETVRARYSWEAVARATMQAYTSPLNRVESTSAPGIG